MNDTFTYPSHTHENSVRVSDFSRNLARGFQLLVLISTVLVIAGLFVRPDETELVLWSIIIPVLPASFLISPALWRAVCPLATLNMLGNGAVSRRRIGKTDLFRAEVIGITLLIILVPARRFILNENGVVLGSLIAVIAVASLVLGLFYASKAGFCNSICPVLPVEKLYGQHPLLSIKNPRCVPCDACTLKGCYDLGPEKAVVFALRGNGTVRPKWKTTAFGLFAAGFPGFIIGYFTVENTALALGPNIYAQILGYMLISGVLFHGAFFLMRSRIDLAVLFLGTLSVTLYNWYSGPAIATAFDLDPAVGTGIRVITLMLVSVWAIRALWTLISEANSPQAAHHPSSH